MEHLRSRAAFSLFQIGGFTADDRDPSVVDPDPPACCPCWRTGSFNGQVEGINELQASYEQHYGPGNYLPNVRHRRTGRCG